MLTPGQCRAARGMLDWSQSDLARAAEIGKSTVRKFETHTTSPNPATRHAIRQAFEAHGIEFTNGEAPGVRHVGGGTVRKLDERS